MENKNRAEESDLFLVHVTYSCDTSFGPKDEWVLHRADRPPALGESGFGRTNCLNYASIQSCESSPCSPNRGVVDKVVPYSEAKLKMQISYEDGKPVVHPNCDGLRPIK